MILERLTSTLQPNCRSTKNHNVHVVSEQHSTGHVAENYGLFIPWTIFAPSLDCPYSVAFVYL